MIKRMKSVKPFGQMTEVFFGKITDTSCGTKPVPPISATYFSESRSTSARTSSIFLLSVIILFFSFVLWIITRRAAMNENATVGRENFDVLLSKLWSLLFILFYLFSFAPTRIRYSYIYIKIWAGRPLHPS